MAFPGPPAGLTEAGSGFVANSSSPCFSRELLEDGILALSRPPQLPDAITRVPRHGCFGFRADVEDDFAKIGLDSDPGTIEPDTLERR